MAPPLRLQGGMILIWLFILCAGVSSYKNECWTFLCVTDSTLNCTCKPEVPNWLVPTICLIPMLIFGTCCIRMCIYYYKEREGTHHSDGLDLFSPPPLPIPEVISGSHLEFRTPPSYDEAVGKPYDCLCPLEDPPAYEDIALHCVTPPDVSIPAILMLNTTSTV